MNISEKIMEIRRKNNLTQEELSEILNVSRQTISNWENGKCYPDIETLITISNKFNISLDNLLNENMLMIKDIDRKVKTNKKLKFVVLIFLIFSITFFTLAHYNKEKLDKVEEINKNILDIPDGYIVYTLDTSKIINYNVIKVNDIDIYIVNDKMDKNIINNPLVYNAKYLVLRDSNGKTVFDIKNAKYLLIGVPEKITSTLFMSELLDCSFLITESTDNSYTGINIEVNNYLEEYLNSIYN